MDTVPDIDNIDNPDIPIRQQNIDEQIVPENEYNDELTPERMEREKTVVMLILFAFMTGNINYTMNLITQFRTELKDSQDDEDEEYDEKDEEDEDDDGRYYEPVSYTDKNIIFHAVNSNSSHTIQFIHWFIENIAIQYNDSSKGIYVFHAFKEAIFSENLVLAQQIFQLYGNEIDPDELFSKEFTRDIIDEFTDNEEPINNNINILMFIANTIYDNNFIESFENIGYSRDYLNENQNMLMQYI